MSKQIGFLGNGAQAREAEAYIDENIQIVFRAVSSDYIDSPEQGLIDIESPENYVDTPVIAAIGPPKLKKQMVKKWPGKNYANILAKNIFIGEDSVIGNGSIIAPGVVITTNVVIGEHTIVNIGSTINHDCKIGDFVTISPGVHIAGNVRLGAGVFIGIGASISNGVTIASGSVIGAGAVVIKDIKEENSVVVGNPAKTIKVNQDWLNEI